MSLNAMNVVWLYYPGGGPMLVLALALADEADDYGGGISASNAHLAKKTRQSERAVHNQVKKFLDTQILERLKVGEGRGRASEYRLNLSMLVNGKGVHAVQGGSSERGARRSGGVEPEGVHAVHPLPADHIKEVKELPEASRADVATFTLSGSAGDDDYRLARWMLELLRKLNPNHREPSWAAWTRDIRRMREQDKRTRRDVAELFAWANADPFWQTNVLSPGTLRRQWERLELQRRRNGGVHALRPTVDTRCSWDQGGDRCKEEGVFGHPDGRRFCRKHEEAQERERVGT